jgi:hypothetical protein
MSLGNLLSVVFVVALGLTIFPPRITSPNQSAAYLGVACFLVWFTIIYIFLDGGRGSYVLPALMLLIAIPATFVFAARITGIIRYRRRFKCGDFGR